MQPLRVRNRPAPLHRPRPDAARSRWAPPRSSSNSQGFVLDPILSLRRSLTLAPGERVQVSLVLAAGETREAGPRPDGQVQRPACHRSGDGFRLGLGPARAAAAAHPARRRPPLPATGQPPALSQPPPAPAGRTHRRGNRKGQAGLWPYGISGDLPIALVVHRRDAGRQPGPPDAPGPYATGACTG